MANGVLKYRKYQDQRKGVPSSGKWYGRAVQDRTVEFADFVTHMANHKTVTIVTIVTIKMDHSNILSFSLGKQSCSSVRYRRGSRSLPSNTNRIISQKYRLYKE